MIKKITLGETNLSDLHQIFKLDSSDSLAKKRVRLFPTGNTETEIATTSIFLASLSAVKEYREELLTTLDVNKIKTRNVNLHIYTELENNSKEERPDGLLVITSGKHNPIIEWVAFVEAKVSDNKIDEKQIERYINFGKEIGVNTIITISNEMVTSPKDSPVSTKKKVNLFHWSWSYLKVIASKLVREEAIADEDHVYILTELRRYMDNHKNLKSYNHMGKAWKDSVTKIHSYEQDRKIDSTTLAFLVSSYKQEEKDISLQLMDKSNYLIQIDTKVDRSPIIEKMLNEKKVITTPFIIKKNKASQLFYIETDFIRQEIRCKTLVIISKGKAQAQTTALLKLLDQEGIGTSDDIWIRAIYPRNKSVSLDVPLSLLLVERTENEFYSILDKSLGNKVKFFEVMTKDLLSRNFSSPKNFIERIESISFRFLQQVMSSLIK